MGAEARSGLFNADYQPFNDQVGQKKIKGVHKGGASGGGKF